MSTPYTPRINLAKYSEGDLGWAGGLNGNMDTIDRQMVLGPITNTDGKIPQWNGA
jgi:hypothetical protein